MVLFDDAPTRGFEPLSDLRSVADLLFGGRTLRERWDGLDVGFGATDEAGDGVLVVNARLIAGANVAARLKGLACGAALKSGDSIVAVRLENGSTELKGPRADVDWAEAARGAAVELWPDAPMLQGPNDLFSQLDVAIADDLDGMVQAWGCRSGEKPEHAVLLGDAAGLWMAEGSEVEAAVLDLRGGPIVLGPGATVQSGALIKGPVVIGANSTVAMGAQIYGPTALGPHCKVGGEVKGVSFQGYSNKGHHGYLGDSVIGRWCNLGAGTTCSNLKNTYGRVRQWNAISEELELTELQFCGVVMGDHVKCGIGTVINTGTVIGTGSVIFDVGFPPKHLPSFSWYNARTGERTAHRLTNMIQTAEHVMGRRGMHMDDVERRNLEELASKE